MDQFSPPPLPPASPPPASSELRAPTTSTKAWLPITVIAAIIVLLLALFASQQGAYLQTKVLGNPVISEDSGSAVVSNEPDNYTKIEAYCNNIREAHVTNCGDTLPQDNYRCRTEEADQVLKTCMDTTTINDIEPEEDQSL